jgi:hypothetical protein
MRRYLFTCSLASMRRLPHGLRACLFTLALASLPWSPAVAQSAGAWRSLGPPGGTVLALVKSPLASTLLYAGTSQNGVFVSADAGQSWSAANAGLPATPGSATRAVRALVADNQYLYAATDAGMFYAAAGAVAGDVPNWSPMPATASATPITLLAVDVSSGLLFAAATGATMNTAPAVYLMPLPAPAAAPAAAWIASPMPGTVVGNGIGAMAVVPSNGTASASLLVSALDRVYSASIGGGAAPLNWQDADPFMKLRAQGAIEALHFSVDFGQGYACSGSQMFLATQPQVPAANDWTVTMLPAPAAMAPTCNAMASGGLPAANPVVALATNTGVYLSTNGTSFTAAAPLAVSPNANAVMIAGDMAPALFVGAGFGVASQALPSIVPNSNWTANNGPAALPAAGANGRLNNANVTDSTVVGATMYAAVASDQYADVLVSTDAGVTWASTGLGQAGSGVADVRALASDSTNRVVYAGTNVGLFALTIGASWQPVAAASIADVASLARDGNLLYVGTDAGAYSLALGASPASTAATRAGLDTLRVSALLADGGKVYAATQDVNVGTASVSVAPSVASGSPAWTDFATGAVGTRRIRSLALAGTTLLAGTRGDLVSAATPGGNWADASYGLRDPANPNDPNRVVTALYSDGTTVYAATGSNGIFSSPVGASLMWTPFNGGGDQALPALQVNQLRAQGTLLYAGTAGGLASFDGLVANDMPPPAASPMPPVADQGGHGGGAFDFWSILGLALLVCLLAAIGKSNHGVD